MSDDTLRGCDVLVQSELDRTCRGFAGIGPSRPARILVRGGSPAAETAALGISDALADELSSLGSEASDGTLPCDGGLQTPCRALYEPQTLNLLVWVGTGSGVDPAEEQAVEEWGRMPNAIAVAVIPPGANPDIAVPPALRRLQAIVLEPRPRQTALEILGLAGIDAAERRVFVSYSHADGIELAHAVVQALIPARFSVFLDSFALSPGADFAERIEHELLGKAFLILIETPEALRSEWVDRELAFARRHRLGIATVWRGAPDPKLEGIGAGRRWELGRKDLRKSAGGPVLTEAAASSLREFVVRRHAATIAYRRRILEWGLKWALHGAGLGANAVTRTPDGLLVQTPTRRCNVSLRPRPAELIDMHEASRRTEPGNLGVMVSATPRGRPERAALAWLSHRSKVVHWDEGKLHELARRLAR